jgi:hypothetical protein
MLHLGRGKVFADGADMRLSACRSCISEQIVMARALRAAVSNLSDHRNGAARTRIEFTSTFSTKTLAHASLLQNFDTTLASLADIPLHPNLVTIAYANGRIMETLLDTVPVEREKAWANQCMNSHQRLLTLFNALDTDFSQLGTPASREEEARQDLDAEEKIKLLSTQVEDEMTRLRDVQAQNLMTLTSDHKQVVSVVLDAINDDVKAQASFSTLESMSKASASILPSMEANDVKLKEIMMKVAEMKTEAMKRMKIRLRQVSIAQSTIQRVLSSLGVLRDALTQQCENISHLEHVINLPASYRDFLSEIRRRRAYGSAVSSTSNAMVERLASMRIDEMKAREKFLKGAGRHLMPSFFDMFVPTLATAPPLFTPQLPAMVEMDTLPDVGPPELDENEKKLLPDKRSELNQTPVHQNISTEPREGDESSLTDSQPNQRSDKSVSIEPQDDAKTAVTRNNENQSCLIVSADENSGHDVEMGSDLVSGEQAEADAERKTLEYENAMLRQAIERMGVKSPRTYLEAITNSKQLQSSNDDAVSSLTSKLENTQKELEQTKLQLTQTTEALSQIKLDDKLGKVCDKISHSSFNVGDVGLFMPTGRGSGGKRTYLAFHTNCPHRYLSTDSIEGTPDYVLGRIIYQEEHVAGVIGSDTNPHGLHAGTKFWILTVEVLKAP